MSTKPGVDYSDPRVMSRDQLESEVLALRSAIGLDPAMVISKLTTEVSLWKREADRWINRNRILENHRAVIRELVK